VESEFLPNEQISLVLHADNQVNELFINRLLKEIPKTFTVYKAVKKSGQLGVLKLNVD